MKISKIILTIAISFITVQHVYAGDNYNDPNSLDFMQNSDVNNVVNINNSEMNTIFDKDSTKVIHTQKGKFWSRFSLFGKKKKKNADKPIVIDYDYDTEKEEIIPIVQEQKVEPEEVKESKKDTKINNKKKDEELVDLSNTDVNIYCDNMDYDDVKKEITGTGNAKIVFTENNSYMTAKKIVYNYDLNYFEGIGDVRVVKDGIPLEGDYTKVDLNFGNVFVDKPIIDTYLVKISAKSGNVTTDSLEAYEGTATVKGDYEQQVYSSQYASFFQMDSDPELRKKFYPKEFRNRSTKYHIKTKEIYINSTDDNDIVTLKNADIYAGKILLIKGTDLKLSTDKTQSYVETTLPEIGSRRYVGAYVGPGFVFNTPGSSTLKLAPLLSLSGRDLGVGLLARVRRKKNMAELIYTTAENDFVLQGVHHFGNSDFQLEYSHLSYVNDWFFGSGISKNLVQLAYQKRYAFPEIGATFAHRASAGYLTNEEGGRGTTRLRYMAQYTQRLISYEDFDKKILTYLDLVTQGMMGVYGTGDSTGIFRIGPTLTTQYRGWRQQVGYYQSAIGGASPLKYTDTYRYGLSSVSIVETLRINKYISVSYYGVLNLTNDDYYTKNMLSESRMSISFGPDEAKVSFGYDVIRQGARLNYTALIGSKNQDFSFKKLFMKNPGKFAKNKDGKNKKENAAEEQKPQNNIQEIADKETVVEDPNFSNTIQSPMVFPF